MRQNGARATPIKSKSGRSKPRWRLSSMDVQSVELMSARRSRRLSGERSKQPREEVLAAPSPHLIRHSQSLPANDVVLALDRDSRNFAFVTFQDGQEGPVTAVDILAELELAFFIY